jgi:hypothetical protein
MSVLFHPGSIASRENGLSGAVDLRRYVGEIDIYRSTIRYRQFDFGLARFACNVNRQSVVPIHEHTSRCSTRANPVALVHPPTKNDDRKVAPTIVGKRNAPCSDCEETCDRTELVTVQGWYFYEDLERLVHAIVMTPRWRC